MNLVKQEILSKTISSTVADLGATTDCGWVIGLFIPTSVPSGRVFYTSLGQVAEATNLAKFMHQVWEPVIEVDIVSRLQQNFLWSISKFALTPGEVKIIDGHKTMLTSMDKPAVKGWIDPMCGLWHIPLHQIVTNNKNTKPYDAQEQRWKLQWQHDQTQKKIETWTT